MLHVKVILCFGLFSVGISALTPTEAQIQAAKDNLKNAILAKPELGPKALRLIFHDCVSPKCDGCINLNVKDNKGLAEPITDLEKIFKDNNHHLEMSRADFWALAAIVGVEDGVRVAKIEGKTVEEDFDFYIPGFVFTPGRVDCLTSPSTSQVFEFPHAHMNNQQMFDYFDRVFGFTPFQTTSLMAAHNLGKMTKENSGFSAPTWTFNPQTFNDNYYHVMVEVSYIWTQINQGNSTHPNYIWQCIDSDGGVSCGHMLNTDVELLLDIEADETGMAGCTFLECDEVPTGELVRTYDVDLELMAEDFINVFTLMINRI